MLDIFQTLKIPIFIFLLINHSIHKYEQIFISKLYRTLSTNIQYYACIIFENLNYIMISSVTLINI